MFRWKEEINIQHRALWSLTASSYNSFALHRKFKSKNTHVSMNSAYAQHKCNRAKLIYFHFNHFNFGAEYHLAHCSKFKCHTHAHHSASRIKFIFRHIGAIQWLLLFLHEWATNDITWLFKWPTVIHILLNCIFRCNPLRHPSASCLPFGPISSTIHSCYVQLIKSNEQMKNVHTTQWYIYVRAHNTGRINRCMCMPNIQNWHTKAGSRA